MSELGVSSDLPAPFRHADSLDERPSDVQRAITSVVVGSVEALKDFWMKHSRGSFQTAHKFYYNIPPGAFKETAKSFVFSTVAGTILSLGAASAGLHMGALAATAAIIDTLFSATLRTCFEVESLTWYQNYGKLIISITLGNTLWGSLLTEKIGVVFTIATYFFVDAIQKFPIVKLDDPTKFLNYTWSPVLSGAINFFQLAHYPVIRAAMVLL